MKKQFILAALLTTAMTASAKGDITVTPSAKTVAPGEVVTITVNLDQPAEEVRSLSCTFTLPEGLSVVSNSVKYNTERVSESFMPTLRIKDGGSKSVVSFLSMEQVYITGLKGDLFSFQVKASKAMPVDFDIKSELNYDLDAEQEASYDEDKVKFNVVNPAEIYYTMSAPSLSLEGKKGIGEGTVVLSLDNSKKAAGGLQFDIELPEGMSIAKNTVGKVVWKWGDRVSTTKSISEYWLSDRVLRVVAIDFNSDDLVVAGSGAVLSFDVKGSADMAIDDQIVIRNISVSDIDAVQTELDDITIAVKNQARLDEEKRVEDNKAAFEADMLLIEALGEEYTTAINAIEALYKDEAAEAKVGMTIANLGSAANAAFDVVTESGEGEYKSVVDAVAIRAEIAQLAADAAARKAAEDARVAANNAAFEADMVLYNALSEELTAAANAIAEEYKDAEAEAQLFNKVAALATAADAALEAVTETGEYKSVVDAEAIRAEIAKLTADAADRKAAAEAQAEADRVAANAEAYEDDLATLKKLTRRYDDVLIILQDDYSEYIDKMANNQVKYDLEDAKDAVEKAYKKVEKAGVYVSPFDAEEMTAAVNKLLEDAQAKKNAADAALANENAWTAVKSQIANVQEALDNFDEIVGAMNYASRYEGEEVTGPVDAAREWVEATLVEYEAKHEAKELTAEDGVMGEMKEHVAAVYEALNIAAKYDVSRYVQAAVYAWAGDEEDIEGARDGVMANLESLPTAGQSALLEQIDLLEAAMADLMAEFEAYTLYNEDTHAAIIAQAESFQANIDDVVAAAEQAVEDYVAVQALLAETQAKIDAAAEAVAAAAEAVNSYNHGNQAELEAALAELEAALDELAPTTDAEEAAEVAAAAEALVAQAEALVEEAGKEKVLLGDVTQDGKVNVQDLSTIVSIVLEKVNAPEVGTLRYIASDANCDGNINIGDYTAVCNIILGKTNASKVRARYTTEQALGETVAVSLAGNMLHVSLDNLNDYAAMQFDVALPAGVTVRDIASTLRTEGMSLQTNRLANGMTRVVIFSNSGKAISGLNGDIAVLELSAAVKDAAVTNVVAADANARTFAIDGAGDATAIAAIKAEAGAQAYDLDGRAMPGVKKGVNIVRNADGTTTKVVVK